MCLRTQQLFPTSMCKYKVITTDFFQENLISEYIADEISNDKIGAWQLTFRYVQCMLCRSPDDLHFDINYSLRVLECIISYLLKIMNESKCIVFPSYKVVLYWAITGFILPRRWAVCSAAAVKPPPLLFGPGCWLCPGSVRSFLLPSLGESPTPCRARRIILCQPTSKF